jgi:hypothetical protein
MNSRLLLSTRVIQLVAGIAVLFFGFGFWLDIWLWDMALGSKAERSEVVLIFSMLALPGLIVAIGSYLQTIYYKTWALVLVCVGGVGAAAFVGINVFFLYAYTGSTWGMRAVAADLCLIALVLPLAITNAILLKRPAKGPVL